jgi:hypothetical protein
MSRPPLEGFAAGAFVSFPWDQGGSCASQVAAGSPPRVSSRSPAFTTGSRGTLMISPRGSGMQSPAALCRTPAVRLPPVSRPQAAGKNKFYTCCRPSERFTRRVILCDLDHLDVITVQYMLVRWPHCAGQADLWAYPAAPVAAGVQRQRWFCKLTDFPHGRILLISSQCMLHLMQVSTCRQLVPAPAAPAGVPVLLDGRGRRRRLAAAQR